MRGSDPRELAPGARSPAHVPRVPERVFKASLGRQLGEGVWLLVAAMVLPGLAVLGGLLYQLLRGETSPAETAFALAPVVFGAAAPLIGALARGMRPTAGGTAKCAWVALGGGYIRLGMSFLRPRILFDQIIDIERGWIDAKRAWRPAEQTHAVSEPADTLGPDRRASAPHLSLAPSRSAQRIRVRFVMRGTWEVVTAAYPRDIDPTGELTSQLELAARHTRAKLDVAQYAPDAQISARYAAISRRYEAEKAGASAGAGLGPPTEDHILPPTRSWQMPKIDAPPASLGE